ncbi:MAG: GNAT family N-acetyltransferase [Acidobacteria bacterium]|nr:GNAT family N-acetyltransferase [Acidobacteriota bacterium]
MSSTAVAHRINALGQPIGPVLPDWRSAQLPSREPIEGRTCRVEKLDAGKHAHDLYEANSLDTDGRMWTYMAYGPFASFAPYRSWVEQSAQLSDPFYYAIVDRDTGKATGVASHLRIDPRNGVIEVGHIAYSPLLARTTAATEAMFRLMQRAFELGYRRYEWKCDALNAPSRAAASRLGFTFEGIFRQAIVVKGRNRDTAWYAILDREWPALRHAFERWLDPANFDARGVQRVALSALRPAARAES